jgi:hypothetical protein
MSAFRLCENCTVRNCTSTPKKGNIRDTCGKRVPYKSGVSLLDKIMEASPVAAVELVWDHGLQITEGKRGFRVSRRKVSDKDTLPL